VAELSTTTTPLDDRMVWVLTITPKTETDENRRKLGANSKYAEWLARKPEMLGVSWSRTAVNAVLELVGGERAAKRICLDPQAQIAPVGWFATPNPIEWSQAHSSVERAAREALGAGTSARNIRSATARCAETNTPPTSSSNAGFCSGPEHGSEHLTVTPITTHPAARVHRWAGRRKRTPTTPNRERPMNYQDALQEWGARRLEANDAANRARDRAHGLEPLHTMEPCPVDRTSVLVQMEFVPEDIGGSSMDTSAECSVSITGYSNRKHWVKIDVEDFDFVSVLGEIVAAGDGRIDTPAPVPVPDPWEL